MNNTPPVTRYSMNKQRIILDAANSIGSMTRCETRMCSREKKASNESWATFQGRRDKLNNDFMSDKIKKAAFMKESRAIARDALHTPQAVALQQCAMDKCREEAADLIEKALLIVGHQCKEEGKKRRCTLLSSVRADLRKGDVKTAFARLKRAGNT